MRAILAGGSGAIGRRLATVLAADGWHVVVLSRTPDAAQRHLPPHAHVVGWDGRAPRGGWEALLDAPDVALVNLVGESVAGPWTAARQQAIRDSRVAATDAIAEAIGRARVRPSVLLQASAGGYYGDMPLHPPLPESAPPGHTFLARVCAGWEAAAADVPVRTVILRLGIMLAPEAGAFPALLAASNLMVGRVGTGQQPLAWVHHRDVTRALHFLLVNALCHGVYNIAAPGVLTNDHFMAEVARARGRMPLLPLPTWALRATLGAAADVLLHGQSMSVERLRATGFTFHHPTLRPALHELLSARPHRHKATR